jgi:hypothetical protein
MSPKWRLTLLSDGRNLSLRLRDGANVSAAFLRDSHGCRRASVDATSLGAGGAAAPISRHTTWQGGNNAAEAQHDNESSLERGMHFGVLNDSCMKRK